MINLELIFEALRELHDVDYQSALWTGQVQGEQSSFTEAICVLFNDAGLERELDSGSLDRVYSERLCLQARHLSKLVRLVDDNGIPDQTLNHPKMKVIREAAKTLSDLFRSETHLPRPDSPPQAPRG